MTTKDICVDCDYRIQIETLCRTGGRFQWLPCIKLICFCLLWSRFLSETLSLRKKQQTKTNMVLWFNGTETSENHSPHPGSALVQHPPVRSQDIHLLKRVCVL